MNLFKLLPVLVFALVLSACGGSAASMPDSAAAPAMPPADVPAEAGSWDSDAAMEEPAYAEKAPALDSGYVADDSAATVAQRALDRLVVRTADMSLQVESVRDAENAIRARANQLGGYVVDVRTRGSDEDMTSEITIRVPSDRFDDALNGVQGLAVKVLNRSISGQDVTEEFVDLESRLRNLEATRDRLVTFLDRATRVEDALSVNRSLTEIQGEIELVRGRMNYLRENARLSTISVFLQPVPAPTAIVQAEGWQPAEVARAALRDLLAFGQGIANIAIVFVVWSPVWLPLLVVVLWLIRRSGLRPGKPVTSSAPESGPTP